MLSQKLNKIKQNKTLQNKTKQRFKLVLLLTEGFMLWTCLNLYPRLALNSQDLQPLKHCDDRPESHTQLTAENLSSNKSGVALAVEAAR